MAVTHICIYRHIDAKEEEKERANKTDQKREWSVSGGIERVKEEERNARSAAAAVCKSVWTEEGSQVWDVGS